jgi:hypothetical protein
VLGDAQSLHVRLADPIQKIQALRFELGRRNNLHGIFADQI